MNPTDYPNLLASVRSPAAVDLAKRQEEFAALVVNAAVTAQGTAAGVLCRAPATAAQDATPRKLLTARDAAKVLGCCEKTLWTLTQSGEIPCVRIGRAVRYDPADLYRWIESAKSKP
jgi:excisionase family DNA binding protein